MARKQERCPGSNLLVEDSMRPCRDCGKRVRVVVQRGYSVPKYYVLDHTRRSDALEDSGETDLRADSPGAL